MRPGKKNGSAFVPAAAFSSFTDAPLAGMCLFGLNISKRPPYVDSSTNITSSQLILEPPFQQLKSSSGDESFPRISSLDAILTHNWHWLSMKSGTFLETLYNCAVVMASRGNGPSGCPFPKFMQFFIQELTTVRRSLPPHSKITADFPEYLPIVSFGENNSSLGCFQDIVIPLLSPMPVARWAPAAVNLMKLAVAGGECCLGTFLCGTANDRVDHMIIEFNYGDSGSSLLPSPPIGDKTFNNFDHEDHFDKNLIKRISLAAECKNLSNNLTLNGIKNIILSKFQNLNEVNLAGELVGERNEGPKSCKTFMILTIKVHEWKCAGKRDTNYLRQINHKNFYLWHLSRVSKGGSNEPPKYTVLPVCKSSQVERKAGFKDVIVVPLSEIVGADFSDKLFSYVQEGAQLIADKRDKKRRREEKKNAELAVKIERKLSEGDGVKNANLKDENKTSTVSKSIPKKRPRGEM